MWMQSVIFSAPKDRYQAWEWEDGGGWGYGPAESAARFAVADGATEGYESRRWVSQLIGSFLAAGDADTPPGPALSRDGLRRWLASMQECWALSIPPTTDYIDRQKISQGALATFVGCQLDGLDGRSPSWHAVALGDAVLFHVRDGRLADQLPRMSAADFGTAPEGFSSRPERLDASVRRLKFGRGPLICGDLLFAATDAFAKWMLTWVEKDQDTLWRTLAALAHPDHFDRLVGELRQSKAMKDDDVTLLRVRLLPQRAWPVVVCR